MGRIAKAAASYFGIAFLAGFAFGAVRTLLVAPRVGDLVAVLIEAPLILAVSWLTAAWSVRRFGLAAPGDRLAAGFLAFLLLQTAETVLSGILGPAGFAANVAAYWMVWSPARVIGLLVQIVFGVLPLFIRPGSAYVRT